MGKSSTFTFSASAKVNNGNLDLFGWDCKVYGRPTKKNVEAYRQKLNESFGPNGHNWSMSKACGVQIHVSEVTVTRQSTGEVVAVAKAPMFEVV